MWEVGARPHWGKAHRCDRPGGFASCWPVEWPLFCLVADALDPAHVFHHHLHPRTPPPPELLPADCECADQPAAVRYVDAVTRPWEEKWDVVVVGAGMSGAALAERHAAAGAARVLVLESRQHIGGNCYDYIDESSGLRVCKYGAHLFHTDDDEVWAYVNRFGRWDRWEHRVVGDVDGRIVPIPVNIVTRPTICYESFNVDHFYRFLRTLIADWGSSQDTVNELFPEAMLGSAAEMVAWLAAETDGHKDAEPANAKEMAVSRVGPRATLPLLDIPRPFHCCSLNFYWIYYLIFHCLQVCTPRYSSSTRRSNGANLALAWPPQ